MYALTVKEPSMTVDLLLITFLETEEDLDRHDPLLSPAELEIRVD